jgi:hypothetical protein
MTTATAQPDRLKAWLDSLPSFGPEPAKPKAEGEERQTCNSIGGPSTVTTKAEARQFSELKKGQTAADRIGQLPRPGEVMHLLMDATFDGIDLLAGIVKLLEPATVTELLVTTLSFNRRVGERLLELIDSGRVTRCRFVASALFQGKERAQVDWLADELEHRGGRLTVERNHTKLMAMSTSDGRHIVTAGSQNLRRCHCFEQVCISDDRGLFEFYRDFIERTSS